MSEQRAFTTTLTAVNDRFFPLVAQQLAGNGIQMDNYAKQCVINALSAIHTALDAKGISWFDKQLDQSNITQILLTVACLKLNASASPREVYFQTRNVAVRTKDETGKDVTIWKKKIEMGIEGDGNDAILARFGRDVQKVGQFWLVREHDEFVYPQYNGLEVIPPQWKPSGKGNVVRVVYPLLKTDGTFEYHIAERDDVAHNLIAHLNNNLMNETFGICEDRYKATFEQKKKIADKKAEVLRKAKDLGLAALDDPELQSWISPAWTEYHSREQMIIRKMRNNVVKKIPKDFGSAYVEMTYSDQTDETMARVRAEIAEHANSQDIDIEGEAVHDDPDPRDPGHADDASDAAEPTSRRKPSGKPQQQTLTPTGTDGPGY